MEPPKSYREERPWGEFIQFTKNTPSTVKIIVVKPHQTLSLQKHAKRDEFWRVISGNGSATIGDKTVPLSPDAECFVPRGTKHRIGASDKTLNVLEISFGDFDENDIERFEDSYGRV